MSRGPSKAGLSGSPKVKVSVRTKYPLAYCLHGRLEAIEFTLQRSSHYVLCSATSTSELSQLGRWRALAAFGLPPTSDTPPDRTDEFRRALVPVDTSNGNAGHAAPSRA